MRDNSTNAAIVARDHDLEEKSFRARLRRNLPEHHTHGSWKCEIGSDKALAMRREAKAMRDEK
ncbi:hypothetical protein ACFSOZ_15355 [Mesorhizobium newzealandense]|uniref:Uncharacterized protein n=1 Tax=Mesorhizobium newzealandense TaxID=1300302 RepID=A0ABW4U8Z4_9HYPH